MILNIINFEYNHAPQRAFILQTYAAFASTAAEQGKTPKLAMLGPTKEG
jgi:hypothetical protein